MGLFKTKEEFDQAVDERVKAIQAKSSDGGDDKKADDTKADDAKKADDTKADDAKKAEDTKADDSKKTDDDKKADDAKKSDDDKKADDAKKADDTKSASDDEAPKWAKDLMGTLDSLKTRIEKMENSPDAQPANGEETDADTKKSATSTQDVPVDTVEADFEDSINPKYKGKFSGLFGDLRG